MTNEEMRVAVGEVCGLSVIKAKNGGYFTVLRKTKQFPDGYEYGSFIFEEDALSKIPDYPNDLNACAAMRKALTADERIIFTLELLALGGYLSVQPKTMDTIPIWATWIIADAPADAQCRAFLKAKKLWKV